MKCPISAKFTCMCGDYIDHSCWAGHTPVSQWSYYECTEIDTDNPHYQSDLKTLNEKYKDRL